jgi:twitching motility protein PilT
MALVDSLLTAMVRANGDALVMHVGEKPYVVTESRTIDLSTHGLNLSAMVGMLAQLLPAEAQGALQEFGAVEHELPSRGADRFAVVAARGGDDIWIEIRRRRQQPPAPRVEPPAPVIEEPAPAEPQVLIAEPPAPSAEPVAPPQAQASEDAPALYPFKAAPAEAEATEEQPPSEEPPNEEPLVAAQVGIAVYTEEFVVPVAEPFGQTHEHQPVFRHVSEHGPGFGQVPEHESDFGQVPRLEPELAVGALATPDAADFREDLVPVGIDGDEVVVMTAPPAMTPEVAEEPTMYDVQPSQPRAAADETVAPVTPLEPAEPQPVGAEAPVPAMAEREPSPLSTTSAVPPAPARIGADDGPLTRTVRIEVPSRPVPSRTGGADRFVRAAAALGASDLFLTSQARPFVRLAGELRPLEGEQALTSAEVEAILGELGPDVPREALAQGRNLHWTTEIAEVGAVEFSTFRDHRGLGALCRLSVSSAAPADTLGLAPEALALTTEPDGLIVVTGPRGSGKSTMLAAFVDAINRQRADYIITLEPEIRVLHENRHALISQRASGADAGGAARAALRENPDVLVIDDLDGPDVTLAAFEAAAHGALVIVAVAGGSTAGAIAHLLDLVPAEHRAEARAQLASSFRGALAQVLLRKAGGGRQVARELLLGTGLVARVLQDGQLSELPAVFETGRRFGMATLTDALTGYVQAGVVDIREAYRKAPDRGRLLAGLRAAGVDTTLIDRIA